MTRAVKTNSTFLAHLPVQVGPDGDSRTIQDHRVDNDGIHLFAFYAHNTYRLAHDGEGWAVVGGGLLPDHTYRLTQEGNQIRQLGEITLNALAQYKVVFTCCGAELHRLI